MEPDEIHDQIIKLRRLRNTDTDNHKDEPDANCQEESNAREDEAFENDADNSYNDNLNEDE
jgi:hypothetical protein